MSIQFLMEENNCITFVTKSLLPFVIDSEDFDRVIKYNWTASGTKNGPRIRANIDGKLVYLHRFLLGVTDPKILVDHRNGNVLDFRKSNLRITDASGNAMNKVSKRSEFGVNGVKKTESGKFSATITVDYQEIKLGTYIKLEEAIKARLKAEKQYYGDFAPSSRYDLSGFNLDIDLESTPDFTKPLVPEVNIGVNDELVIDIDMSKGSDMSGTVHPA